MSQPAAASPSLLDELRRLSVGPDWRRAEPHPRWAELDAATMREAPSWHAADRAEAHLLLTRLAVDPEAHLRAAFALTETAPARRGVAFNALMSVARSWTAVEGRIARGAERATFTAWAAEGLAALFPRFPLAPAPRIAFARIMDATGAAERALDCLAAAPGAPAVIAPEYLRVLMRRLRPLAHRGVVARAFDVPAALREAAPAVWPIFVLVRALCLRIAHDQPAVLARLRSVDPEGAAILEARPPEEADLAAQAEAFLEAVRAAEPTVGARMLRQAAGEELLLRAPGDAADRMREVLLAEADRLAAAQATAEEPRLLAFSAAFHLLPACGRCWTDAAFRRERARHFATLLDGTGIPQRHGLAGLFAFTGEDYDAAGAAFAAVTAGDRVATGPSTYLDFRAVPAILARPPRLPGALAPLAITSVQEASGEAAVSLVVSANGRYLRRFGPSYAEALQRHAAGTRLHVHLIGDPAEEQDALRAMASSLPGIALTLSAEPVTVAEPYYFATARFLRLAALRQALPGRLLVTDIDLGWPVPPVEFLDRMMGEADAGLSLRARVRLGTYPGLPGFVRHYPRTVPWISVAAWAVAVAPNAPGRAFAEALSRVAAESLARAAEAGPGGKWTIDQNILMAAYAHAAQAMPEVRFADLGFQTDLGQPAAPPDLAAPEGHHWMFRPG